MAEDTAVAIDNVLLDSGGATAIRPAGILNGAVAVTPSSDSGVAGMIEDMRALLAAVPAPVDPIFVSPPSTALTISLPSPASTLPVIVAPTVPSTMLILLDANDFASAEGDQPQFHSSSESLLHEENTLPLPINAGTPSSPVRSLWQTRTIALRILADINWAMVRAGRVAFVDPVAW